MARMHGLPVQGSVEFEVMGLGTGIMVDDMPEGWAAAIRNAEGGDLEAAVSIAGRSTLTLIGVTLVLVVDLVVRDGLGRLACLPVTSNLLPGAEFRWVPN